MTGLQKLGTRPAEIRYDDEWEIYSERTGEWQPAEPFLEKKLDSPLEASDLGEASEQNTPYVDDPLQVADELYVFPLDTGDLVLFDGTAARKTRPHPSFRVRVDGLEGWSNGSYSTLREDRTGFYTPERNTDQAADTESFSGTGGETVD